jgi:hypothetical protein
MDPLRVIFRRAIRREEGVAIDPTEGLEAFYAGLAFGKALEAHQLGIQA